MDLIITILPVVTKDLPISPRFTPYDFLPRCKFSNLTTCQLMVEFYLLTFPRFPLRKKEHKSYFGANRTHDFRVCRLPNSPLGRQLHVCNCCSHRNAVSFELQHTFNFVQQHLSIMEENPALQRCCFRTFTSSRHQPICV